MASVNFRYRSTKNSANLEVCLSFRIVGENLNAKGKENPFFVYSNSKICVEKKYWEELHNKSDFPNYKDIEKRNWVSSIKEMQFSINSEIEKIEAFILRAFNLISEEKILTIVNKEWLKIQLNNYYNPPKNEAEKILDEVPKDIVGYFDFYSDYRKNEISESLRKKLNVVKHKLNRFQKEKKKTLLINEINDNFKKSFVDYCVKEGYAQNTIQRELVFIKTICKHAKYLGIEVHHQMDFLRIERQKVQSIYLSLEDISKIQKLNKLPDYLDNAKDWLIISCFTGQRVSDFMRFDEKMIRYENDKPLLEFTQLKTGKIMTIPILKPVLEIIKKRNGKFPRKITDVNYNIYIKQVCQKAEINDIVQGSKKVDINNSDQENEKVKTDKKIKKFRKITKEFPKYELVSSHIGRRSFATNYYGTIPTSILINITGHSTEQMFLTYIGKSNKDIAKESFKYFEQ